MVKKGVKGQVTLFIIIAVVIVAGIVLFFTITEQGKNLTQQVLGSQEINVEQSLRECLQNDDIKQKISDVLSQGGTNEPTLYYLYQGKQIEYLCYTSQYYQTCYMQKPLLIEYVESEIKKSVKEQVDSCVKNLQEDLTSKGYTLSSRNYGYSVNLANKNIIIIIDYDLSITKEDTQRFDGFEINIPSNAYKLVGLSTSVLNYEARYGDSDPLQYMILYPDVKVEKYKQDDGTKVYILTDRNTNEKFQFAVRSLAWPPGYGL
ncbi:hypothetical protein AUJ62_01820 [Candidatus Pacearchaeota archaeon CG1_02_32_21]|nr:MAG: hypothetical protein AUJ62_01820 [Candidatus Pacearchaeota archaeon CG1_02_32_21]